MKYDGDNNPDDHNVDAEESEVECSKYTDFLDKNDSLYVRRYLKKRLYSHQDLDDALQTTFLEAYRSRSKFRGDSCKKIWVCGIAMNIAKQFNKRNVLKKVETNFSSIYSDDFDLDSILSVSTDSAEDAYALHELTSQLEVSLGELGSEFRDVFSDVVLSGLSYQKAADKYSLPIGTVKSRISWARTHLKKTIN